MTGFITIMLMFAAVGLLVPGRVTRFLTIMFAASLLPGLVSSPATSAELVTPGSKEPASGPAATAQRSPVDAAQARGLAGRHGADCHAQEGMLHGHLATYPNTGWQEVPCITPTPNPQGPRRGSRPINVVGNGNDVSTQAPRGFISQAIGSFDTVTGVTSETGTTFGPNCSSPVSGVPNIFSLQLNANTFFNSSNNVPAVITHAPFG
jgi:hypothetical protein